MLSSAGAVGSRKRLPTVLAWASFIFRSRVSSQPTVRAKREIVAMLTLALAASWSTVALALQMMLSRMASATLRSVTLRSSRRLRIWKTMSRMLFFMGRVLDRGAV